MGHRRTTIPLSGAGLDLDVKPVEQDVLGVAGDARYEIGGVIGSGGMGEVLVAWDRRLGRQVAYKRPRVGAGESLVEEAGVTARLQHPGIVPVYDAGRDARGRPFYTMPLLGGHDLGWHIERAADVAERLRFVRTLLGAAEAVAYAHDTGVVHRDLKPHNIMLGDHGEVRVADWGLAGRVGDRSPHGLGTPGYAPDEQVRGQALDARADVHALGATLWHVLVGAPPPSPVPPVADFQPDAPPELCAIVARATGPLEDRYRDAAGLAADLTAWFEGRRVAAFHYTPGAELRRLARRFRVPLLVAAAGLVAFGAAVTVGWWRTAVAADVARRAADAAQVAERRAQGSLALALVGRAITATERGERAQAELYAASALRLRESPRARGVLARYSGLPRPQRLAVAETRGCDEVAVDMSGTRFACARRGQGAWFGSEAFEHHVVLDVDLETVVFSEAGGVLYGGDERHRVWRLDLTPPVVVADVATPNALLTRRHGGPTLINGMGTLRELERASDIYGGWTPCPDGLGATVMGFGADGAVVAACQDFHTLVLTPALRAPAAWSVRRDADLRAPTSIAVSDDRVYVANLSGVMEVFDRADGRRISTWPIPGPVVLHLALGRDRIAGRAADGSVIAWTADGVELGRLPVRAVDLAWRGDELVSIGRHHVERWSLPGSPRPQGFEGEEGVAGIAVDPAGARVAVGRGDGVVTSYDLPTGVVLWARPIGVGVVKDVAYDPSGRRLVVAASRRMQLDVLDAASGEPVDAWPGGTHRRVSWLRDGLVVSAPYAAGAERWWPDGRHDVVAASSQRSRDLERAADGSAALLLGAHGEVIRVTGDDAALVTTLPSATSVAWGGDGLVWSDGHTVFYPGGETRPPGTRVIDLAAGPGGLVAVGTLDGTIFVYTDGGASLRAEILAHADRVAALEVSADGRWLVSGGWDGAVRVWSLSALAEDPDALVAELERSWGQTADGLLAR